MPYPFRMMSVVLCTLVITAFLVLPSDSTSQFDDEASRIIKNSSNLLSQIQDFPFGRSKIFDDLLQIFEKTGEQIPRGAQPLPTDIIADYVPWPRRIRALLDGQFPFYFPKKGQERDMFGRRYPVYAPF